ncbi:MAG: prenyltransferase/squalene oxidase repeat-containing protein [Anaerolineae bacterium]
MSVRRRIAYLLLTIVISALAPAAGMLHAAGPSDAEQAVVQARLDAADRALNWLAGQQNADAGFGPAGTSDWLSTTLALQAFLARGRDASLLHTSAGLSPADYLTAQAATLPADSYAYAQYILSSVALGTDPREFAGQDWVARLTSTMLASGQFPSTLAPAVEAQYTAIIALRAAYQPVPAAAVSWLKSARRPDGGWGSSPADVSSPYYTGLVLQALILAGEPASSTIIQQGVDYLRTRQNADKGFGTTYPGPSDPLATAAAILGLTAAGQPLYSSPWSTAGQSPFSALLAMQTASGAFRNSNTQADITATAAGVRGLLGRPAVPRHARLSARRAVEWLRTQQAADGGFGAANSTASAVYVIARAGQDPDSPAWTRNGISALRALELALPSYVQGPGNRVAEAGKAAIAAVAAGRSARSFGGFDLVHIIQGDYNPLSGRYYETWLYRHNLAVLGLVAAGDPVPEGARQTLLGDQHTSGGWGWAFGSRNPDVDSTGFTMYTLVAVGEPADSPALARAAVFLRDIQFSDGSFPAISTNTTGNSNSTALALQGLLAAGMDPWRTPYARLSATGAIITPLDALLAFQEDSGAFVYMYTLPESRQMAVFDAVPALMLAAPPAELQLGQAQLRQTAAGLLLLIPYFGDGNANSEMTVRVRYGAGEWSEPLPVVRTAVNFITRIPAGQEMEVDITATDPDGADGGTSQTLRHYRVQQPLILRVR